MKNMGIHDEPCIPDELKNGWDIISFSGDKLLGAPQAGIILGEKTYIDAMKKNPITRALWPDKFTLAGLESTLLLCLDEETAKQNIPTLKMIYEDKRVLKRRAQQLIKKLKGLSERLFAATVDLSSEVGGGSLPDVSIPSSGIALQPLKMNIDTFEEKLRNLEVSVIGRIERDRLLLDMRTILREEEPHLIAGIKTVLKDGK